MDFQTRYQAAGYKAPAKSAAYVFDIVRILGFCTGFRV